MMTFSLARHGATPSVEIGGDVKLPRAPPDGAAVDSAPCHVSSKDAAQMLGYITYWRIHPQRSPSIACIDSLPLSHPFTNHSNITERSNGKIDTIDESKMQSISKEPDNLTVIITVLNDLSM